MGVFQDNHIAVALLVGVLSNLIFAILLTFKARLTSLLDRPGLRWLRFAVSWLLLPAYLLTFVLHVILLVWTRQMAALTLAPYPVVALVVIYVCIKHNTAFKSVGIVGVDPTVAQGTDYKNALDLCSDGFEFLGVGASKLTACGCFEEAVIRCSRRDRPIRLLLIKPDARLLEEAAKLAKRDARDFKGVVRNSLRTIAQIKSNRSPNLQVRFYSTPQYFRLMFINDSLCLFSYYIFGRGDGSQLPQLHVAKATGKHVESTLYHPLKCYYEQLWSKSKIWDFEDYLDD